MDKEFRVKNLKLIILNREKLSLKDEEILEEMRTLVDWKMNLYRLEETDASRIFTVTLDADSVLQKLRKVSREEGAFWFAFHEIMDSLILNELTRCNIGIDKLHYGVASIEGIQYEYQHILQAEYDAIIASNEKAWYKIVTVLPPYRMGLHKNTFYIPGNKLHHFLEKRLYAGDDKYNRVMHIERLTEQQCLEELTEAQQRVKKYVEEKYRIS